MSDTTSKDYEIIQYDNVSDADVGRQLCDVKNEKMEGLDINLILQKVMTFLDRKDLHVTYTLPTGKQQRVVHMIYKDENYINKSNKFWVYAFVGSRQVEKNFPKNNDGRSSCAWCNAPTKTWQGLNFRDVHHVCTKCGR